MPKTTNPLNKQGGVSTNIILTVVVVVVAAVVIGAVLFFSGGGPDRGQNGAGTAASGPVVPAEVLRKPDSHTLVEAPGSKVTVVEFLDYQCSVCKAYYDGVTKKIEQDYGDRITFVTRNYPLDLHPLAMSAAKASEAAALQGKYREMYNALYTNWQSWAVSDNGQEVSDDQQKADRKFEEFARKIGLDLGKFRQDLGSAQVQQRIDQDLADGEKAGVGGTPTIFVNGRLFEPDANAETAADVARQLRKQIDGELAK